MRDSVIDTFAGENFCEFHCVPTIRKVLFRKILCIECFSRNVIFRQFFHKSFLLNDSLFVGDSIELYGWVCLVVYLQSVHKRERGSGGGWGQ